MKKLLVVACFSFSMICAREHIARWEAELKHKTEHRDRLNREIAELTERHSREKSAVRAEEMRPRKKTAQEHHSEEA
jgi:hypothetical protein